MSEQEINIAVAEACGRKSKQIDVWDGNDKIVSIIDSRTPSYTTDLNSIQAAVLAQSQDWQDRFTIELTRLCGSHKLAVNASARKRAEAFLRTIGRWKDLAATTGTPSAK